MNIYPVPIRIPDTDLDDLHCRLPPGVFPQPAPEIKVFLLLFLQKKKHFLFLKKKKQKNFYPFARPGIGG
jgi:hypothetical protein